LRERSCNLTACWNLSKSNFIAENGVCESDPIDAIRVLDKEGRHLGEITINPEKNNQTMTKPNEN
jgi:hypothetical protein